MGSERRTFWALLRFLGWVAGPKNWEVWTWQEKAEQLLFRLKLSEVKKNLGEGGHISVTCTKKQNSFKYHEAGLLRVEKDLVCECWAHNLRPSSLKQVKYKWMGWRTWIPDFMTFDKENETRDLGFSQDCSWIFLLCVISTDSSVSAPKEQPYCLYTGINWIARGRLLHQVITRRKSL